MTQNQIKSRIDYDCIGNHSNAKKTAVAKAVSKFANKYGNVDVSTAIDGCLQFYGIEQDLTEYLERNKSLFTYE